MKWIFSERLKRTVRGRGHDGLLSSTGTETTATFRETRCHQLFNLCPMAPWSECPMEYCLSARTYFHFPSTKAEEETTEPPPDPVNIRVSWRLSQVWSSPKISNPFFGIMNDWILIDDIFRLTIQLAWITLSLTTMTSLTTRAHIQGCSNIDINITTLTLILFRTLGRPFAPQLQIDINSDAVPCDPEFR